MIYLSTHVIASSIRAGHIDPVTIQNHYRVYQEDYFQEHAINKFISTLH